MSSVQHALCSREGKVERRSEQYNIGVLPTRWLLSADYFAREIWDEKKRARTLKLNA
jgi:hypothetical protein